jgi:hypothetical protein
MSSKMRNVSSEHIIGYEDMESCEAEIDKYEDDSSDVPFTIEEDELSPPSAPLTRQRSFTQNNSVDSLGPSPASEFATSDTSTTTPPHPGTGVAAKQATTSSWLSSLASKTFGASTAPLTAGSAASSTGVSPNPAPTVNNSNVLAAVFDDEEEDEKEEDEKEELRELGDYYSSFLERRASKDGEASPGGGVPPGPHSPKRGPSVPESVHPIGEDINAAVTEMVSPTGSEDSPSRTSQSTSSISTSGTQKRPSVPLLSTGSSSRSIGLSPMMQPSPHLAVPPVTTPSRSANSVGGFFSGLLGSTAAGNVQSQDGGLNSGMFTERSTRPAIDAIVGKGGPSLVQKYICS